MLRPWIAVTVFWIIAGALTEAATLHIPADHETLQAAVDAAESGDVIVLAPGDYDGPILIRQEKHGIAIRGDGIGEVTLRNGMEVHATDITVSDLTLEDGEFGVRIGAGASCTIRNVSFWYQETGVSVHGGEAILEDIKCTLCQTAGVVASGEDTILTVRGGLITMTSGPEAILIEDNATATLTDVAVKYNEENGITVQTGAVVEMTDCVVEHNPEYGLWIEHASVITTNCRFGHARCGIWCHGDGAELVIEGGRIFNCHEGCVYRAGAGGSLTGAHVMGNHNGVIPAGVSILVADNWFHDNSYTALYIGPWPSFSRWTDGNMDRVWANAADDLEARPTITGNRFTRNRVGIWSVSARPTNALSLDADNEFDAANVCRVAVSWWGAVRVTRGGVPVADAEVTVRAGDGWSRGTCPTDIAGYAPNSEDSHNGRWGWLYQYRAEGDGTRTQFNPYTVTATAEGGRLRGSCQYSWDGKPKPHGFDVDGRYQVAYVELSAKPVADAGADQTVPAAGPNGAEVTVDASNSSDEDNEELVYSWMEGERLIAGPSRQPVTTVHLAPGIHTLTLLVDDYQDDPAEDQCTINVTAPEKESDEGAVVASD